MGEGRGDKCVRDQDWTEGCYGSNQYLGGPWGRKWFMES